MRNWKSPPPSSEISAHAKSYFLETIPVQETSVPSISEWLKTVSLPVLELPKKEILSKNQQKQSSDGIFLSEEEVFSLKNCLENSSLLNIKFKKGWMIIVRKLEITKQLFDKLIFVESLRKKYRRKLDGHTEVKTPKIKQDKIKNTPYIPNVTSVLISDDLMNKLLTNGIGLRTSVAKLLKIYPIKSGWRESIVGKTIELDFNLLQKELNLSRKKEEKLKEENDIFNLSAYKNRNNTLREIGFLSYNLYLESDLWGKIRDSVLARDDYRCRCCGRPAKVVHHTSYDKDVLLGKNKEPLRSLCNGCHYAIEIHDGDKTSLKSANKHLKNRTKFIKKKSENG